MIQLKTCAAAFAACVALAAPSAFAQGQGGHDMKQDMKPMMEKGHEKLMSMPTTGKADSDFAMIMREHHKSGIEMAQWEIEHGSDPKMKEMAKKIMASQKKEIAEFDKWLDGQKEKR